MYARILFSWPVDPPYRPLTNEVAEVEPEIVNAFGSEPERIELEIVEAAIRLVRDYFWPHSRAALRQIGLNERHANTRRVLRWIKALGKHEVSREEIRRDALGQILDADETQHLLDGLVKAGWLRPTSIDTPGRRRRRWQVNPRLHGTAETAESAERV
jgi:hypothetical protein